jgi:hypothetical protein
MSGILITYREYLQRRAFAGNKQATATTDAQQTRTIELDMPFDAAFALAQHALHQLDGQKVPLPDDLLIRLEALLPRTQHVQLYKVDAAMGRIEAGLRGRVIGIRDLTDFSRLTIQLQRLDEQTTRVHLESRANSVFDLYDLGKNLHYVNELALFLRRESHQQAAIERLHSTATERPAQLASEPLPKQHRDDQ